MIMTTDKQLDAGLALWGVLVPSYGVVFTVFPRGDHLNDPLLQYSRHL